MIRNSDRCEKSRQRQERGKHARSRFDVSPPVSRVERALVLDALRLHMLANVREWHFIFCAIGFRSSHSEIDNEHATWPARDIESIYPRHDYIRIWAIVWIGSPQHRHGGFFIDVEGSAFRVAHKRKIDIRDKARCRSNVSRSCGKICVDVCNFATIERAMLFRTVIETDHADVNVCASKDPGAIAFSEENVAAIFDALQTVAICAATNSLRCE